MPRAILPESTEIWILAADGEINIRLIRGAEQTLGSRQIGGNVIFFNRNGFRDIGDSNPQRVLFLVHILRYYYGEANQKGGNACDICGIRPTRVL